MKAFLQWIKEIFGSKKPTDNVVVLPMPEKPIEKPQDEPAPTPAPKAIDYKKDLLTRMEYVELNKLIIEGKIECKPYGNYNGWREDKGKKNQSKDITPMIKRQGGNVGDAYCQFGQQDKMDAVALVTGIPRKLFAYPEGGGTQRVYDKTDAKYKFQEPLPGRFFTVEYNASGKGHIEDIFDVTNNRKTVKTFGFNTDVTDDLEMVRDGQGAGWLTRPVFKEIKRGDTTVRLRGFTDHYLIYVDAYNKHHGKA